MTNEERDLITGLFNRLRSADNPQKDREAEALINQSVAAQPSVPYLLVQTTLVQEHALQNAQVRIQELEKQLQDARSAGTQTPHHEGGVTGFLSGLFGGQGSSSPSQPAPPPSNAPAYQQPPYPTTANLPASAGGSFLKSALGTAAGVAGGAMLFQGISNLLGHNAGPFGGLGGFGGGGSGFFGGGQSSPEIIENREVVNNYFDGGGNRDNNGGGAGSFLGEDTVGFRPHGESQPADTGDNNFLGEDTVGFRPHEDNRRDDANGGNGDNDSIFSAPFAGEPDSGSLDNSYDADNTDAFGGDNNGGGNDDTSYV